MIPASHAKSHHRVRAATVLVANETPDQRLARAKGYPYPRPDCSFLFLDGRAYEFTTRWQGVDQLPHMSVHDASTATTRLVSEVCTDLTAVQDLTPVLAIGSNAAPQQLARKYPAELFPEGVAIPVIQCVLEDFDVVYAPSVCSYGSCPATLEHCPGTSVRVFVTFLGAKALQRMHETEGTYNLLRLSQLRLHMGVPLHDFTKGEASSEVLSSVRLYNHQHGALKLPVATNPGGTPVALAEIDAANRTFPALTQPQMLHSLRLVFCPQGVGAGKHKPICLLEQRHKHSAGHPLDLDEWILSNIDCRVTRKALQSQLVPWAQPLQFAHVEVLATLG